MTTKQDRSYHLVAGVTLNEDGLFQVREFPVDLAIVDLGLPKLNGLTVVQRLRAEGKALPILILTARGSWQDKVVGLEAGAGEGHQVAPADRPRGGGQRGEDGGRKDRRRRRGTHVMC